MAHHPERGWEGSQGKLTELTPHDTGRVVRLLLEAPTLLRHAIDRLGQQPIRLFESVVCEDGYDEGLVELESVGDFLEEALRRAAALTDALIKTSDQLLAQRLTDLPTDSADGLSWSILPEAQVRRTAQICQWLASLTLAIRTPGVAALRRRDAVDPMRRRRPVYDAMAFAESSSTHKALREVADLTKTVPVLCRDLGQVHGLGLMPLPRQPSEALTFGADSIEAPQNLHCLQDVHAVAFERDNIAYPARWSKCVQGLLMDVVGEIALWGHREQASAQHLRPIVASALSAYLSGFAELLETTCRIFCERALPWSYMMPHLPERPEDPVVGQALQLVADFAVLSRMT